MMRLNIIITPNFAYQQHVKVLIKSILRFHQQVDFYIFNNDYSPEWFDSLNVYLAPLNSRAINVQIEDSLCDNLHTLAHLPPSSFYRFYSSQLPIDKALYLDCDLVVNGSLSALYQTDLGDHLVGAVEDLNICQATKLFKLQQSENIILKELQEKTPKHIFPMLERLYGEDYFNAGVLLLNLKQWRAENTMQKLFETAQNYSVYFRSGDQCVLNWVCLNRYLKLPLTYNYTPLIIARLNHFMPDPLQTAEQENPTIIHYASPQKPWQLNQPMPFRQTYWDCYHLTWQDLVKGKSS